jgi:hypothetical protein
MPTLPSPGTQQQTGREAHLDHAAATVPPTSMIVGLPTIPTLPLASDLPISSNTAVRLSPGADGALPLGLFLGTFNLNLYPQGSTNLEERSGVGLPEGISPGEVTVQWCRGTRRYPHRKSFSRLLWIDTDNVYSNSPPSFVWPPSTALDDTWISADRAPTLR